MSGTVTKLGIGGVGITVETAGPAILAASARPIEAQVAPLPVAEVTFAAKGSVGDIPRLLADQVPALEFRLGGGYAGFAIAEYMDALGSQPFFRYVVVDDPDGRLFAILDGPRLAGLGRSAPDLWDQLAYWLDAGDGPSILRLPGAVSAAEAVATGADKQELLERMEALGVQWLPVIDGDGRFAGIVDRSQLIASLILDVTRQLRAAS
ncbi:MAG: CBS domain-containing protein [Alphaproteobacteria bacterium]|nr:CBS domain-containing protein [Alphaproteobacteria bacterium]